MQYILITPLSPLGANQRAEAISRELYCLTVPRKYQEESQHDCKVFPILMGGSTSGLGVIMDYEIPIHEEADKEAYILLLGDVNVDEVREAITTSSVVTFSQIYPNPVFLTEEEVEQFLNHTL